MANTVGGLRSIQSTSPRPTYDRGQRPIDTGESRPVQLRPVAAPVNRYAPPPVPPQDTRLKQLADALSSLNPFRLDRIFQSIKLLRNTHTANNRRDNRAPAFEVLHQGRPRSIS